VLDYADLVLGCGADLGLCPGLSILDLAEWVGATGAAIGEVVGTRSAGADHVASSWAH
jgi:hypothetical protein